MYLVAIAWIYVVLMMAAAEAINPNGSLLGAAVTFMLYGVLPLGIVMYLLATPARNRARRAREAAEWASANSLQPDQGGHAAGESVAPERKEP